MWAGLELLAWDRVVWDVEWSGLGRQEDWAGQDGEDRQTGRGSKTCP
ncbi:hypothetical protein E2C01_081979 [Portunus trituberculatus]|uniref:Uncharacterized protein n=1 Tax=Portunus trituberculatus TaxID=210409 RepID=A0A5B7J2K2_PORTR|nr:hypothetical protein [Portunus trituberculatus]